VRLVDLNVLLYAVNRDAPHHDKLRRWWEGALAAEEPVGLAWTVLLGFLRLATSARVFSKPLTADQAMQAVDRWLNQGNVRIVSETDDQWRILKDLLSETGTAGNLTTDAHLASLAIAHGAVLVSCDSDFARFPKLRWQNPLRC
jgi:toxin-antitoxin system PIN domain toxin